MIPCQVVFFEDRFYLKCIHAETKEPRTYRIDRMKQIQPGETVSEMPKLPKPKGAILDIFDPKYYETVTLRIKSFLTVLETVFVVIPEKLVPHNCHIASANEKNYH